MLKLVRALKDLEFGALMEVYREGLQENGAALYPNCSPQEQVILAQQDFYAYLRDAFFTSPDTLYALWEEDGRPVSAARLEPYADGLLLAALETDPDMRDRGYGTSLIRGVQSYLSQMGDVRMYSHVVKGNGASLAVHRACGFHRLLDHAVYLDGTVTQGSYTLVWESEGK